MQSTIDDSESKFIEELTSSLKQVQLMEEDKLPKINAKDFLNGL